MAIGDNIRRMRMLKGLTQKELGLAIGFDQKTADVRIAQYESGTRTPKEKMILDLAQVFGVRPEALTTPDIDTYVGLMHTLFTLEDVYGLKIGEIEGELCLRLDRQNKSYPSMFDMFHAWQQQAQKLHDEELSDEGYNQWRYNYPQGEQDKFRQEIQAIRQKKKDK